MKKYLINYTNSIEQGLGQCGNVLLVKCEKYPTTAWLKEQGVHCIGYLVILSITEVPDDWE